MRRWVVVAAVLAVLAVAAGGGWVVAQRQAQAVLDQSVARFREGLGPDRTFSYASATPRVLHRDARFAGVVLAGPEGTLSADTAVVGCDAALACSGTAEGVKLAGSSGAAGSGTAEHVGWTRVEGPAAQGGASGVAERVAGARFDAAEARGVHLAWGGGETDVATVSMAEYGRGRRGRGAVEGVSGSLPAQGGAIHVRVARAAFDGEDVASIVSDVHPAGEPPLPGRHVLEVTGLDVEQGGAVVLHVGRFGNTGDLGGGGVVHEVADATELRGSGPPPLAAGLRRLGYAGFAGEVHLDATLERAADELTVAGLRVAGEDMGQATLSGGFGRIPADGGAAEGPVAALGVTVRGLDLVVVDAGMVQRVFEASAKEAGTDSAAMREAAARQVEAVPVASPAAVAVRKAVAAFVRAPGTLTLGVHPAAPMSLLEVMQGAGQGGGLDGVVGRLNLTAAAAAK